MKHRVNVYITHTRCNKCFKSAKRHLICVMPAQGCGKMHISQTPEANAIKCPRTQLFQERGLIPLITNFSSFLWKDKSTVWEPYGDSPKLFVHEEKYLLSRSALFVFSTRGRRAKSSSWNHKTENEIRSFKRIEHFSLIEEEIYEILSKYQTLFYC